MEHLPAVGRECRITIGKGINLAKECSPYTRIEGKKFMPPTRFQITELKIPLKSSGTAQQNMLRITLIERG